MKIAMKQVLSAAVMAGALLAMSQAQATTKHFKGEPAETLEQAVTNLATYNAKLAAIVNKDKIEPAEIVINTLLTKSEADKVKELHKNSRLFR